MMIPVPSRRSQGSSPRLPFTLATCLPVPLRSGQMSSPVPGVPGSGSSSGLWCLVGVLNCIVCVLFSRLQITCRLKTGPLHLGAIGLFGSASAQRGPKNRLIRTNRNWLDVRINLQRALPQSRPTPAAGSQLGPDIDN